MNLPRRFVIVQHGQGTLLDRWRPQGVGADYGLSQLLRPLERHRSRMLVVSGVSNLARRAQLVGNGHIPANRSLFTATPYQSSVDGSGRANVPRGAQIDIDRPYGPSIDQVIAQVLSTADQRPSIHLDITRTIGNNQMWWRGRPGQVEPVSPERNPARAFESLFGNVEFPGDEPRELSRRERFRQRFPSVLDRVAQSYMSLQRRLPVEDRQALERHAEQIRILESNINVQVSMEQACARPELQSPNGYNASSGEWEHISADNQMQLLRMALACDVTRVATLTFGNSHAPSFDFVNGLRIPQPGYNHWHDMVHKQNDAAAEGPLAEGFEWYSRKVAEFIDLLAETPEGDGSLLDNTLVLWTSEFGNGGRHSTRELPVVLFGSLGGVVRNGEHLSFQDATTNELFVALQQLFGISSDRFGLEANRDGDSLVRGPLEILT